MQKIAKVLEIYEKSKKKSPAKTNPVSLDLSGRHREVSDIVRENVRFPGRRPRAAKLARTGGRAVVGRETQAALRIRPVRTHTHTICLELLRFFAFRPRLALSIFRSPFLFLASLSRALRFLRFFELIAKKTHSTSSRPF